RRWRMVSITGCISKTLLPALGVWGIGAAVVTGGHRRAAPAEPQQLTLGALFKLVVLAVGLVGRAGEKVVEVIGEGVAHLALHPAAGVHRPVGEDGHVAVAAVGPVVDGVRVQGLVDMEQALLVEEEGPLVVLSGAGGWAPGGLVGLELLPAGFQQGPVFQGGAG